jgi:maltooligosyltrehalose trehalohydrolase
VSGNQFLGYVQNHDQLGNRAQGDRLCHLTTNERARIAAALVLTSPFVPMLFQGEEFGSNSPFQYFADFSEEPELAKAVAEGRRKEFGQFGWKPEDVPDPGSPETFHRSKINWSEKDLDPHRSLLDWHIQLIELRRKYPQLTDGRLYLVVTEYDEEKQWLSVERGLVTIIANFANESRAIPLRDRRPKHLLLTSTGEEVKITEDEITLPPNSLAILGPILEIRGQTSFRASVEVLSI